MASSKSHSNKRKPKRSTLFSRLVWVIWAVVTGGGIAGWSAPDLPVVGPLVQRLVGSRTSQERMAGADGGDLREKLSGLKNLVTDAADETRAANPAAGHSITATSAPSRKPAETVTIASFNIQVFGTSKLSKSWVVDILAQVVRQFDVVAIQEVRSKEDRVLPDFVAAINADGSRYNFLIGPRLGRTVSTEQYAFVYDTNRIEIDTSSIGTIQDPRDALHREPFVTRFRTRTAHPENSFSFWLVNIHTDPDEVSTEVNALADVFMVMQQARPDEDDVILLGDLNASDRQFDRLGQVPGITWAVSNTTTNTRHTKMYDNLLFDRERTSEYTGRWGVFELESAFHLTPAQALEVSDHLPVWAEFRIYEATSPGNTARLPGPFRQ